jgi:hypothetical protein
MLCWGAFLYSFYALDLFKLLCMQIANWTFISYLFFHARPTWLSCRHPSRPPAMLSIDYIISCFNADRTRYSRVSLSPSLSWISLDKIVDMLVSVNPARIKYNRCSNKLNILAYAAIVITCDVSIPVDAPLQSVNCWLYTMHWKMLNCLSN